ncbi:twin-arginine translocation signal domain-containing protein, partial [Glaesserella parasuis]
MNKHVNNITPETADLSRRSFLVGTAASGLVLGYAGVPGIA